MAYDYKTEKPRVLTDEGMEMCFRIFIHAQHLTKTSGCAMASHLMKDLAGDSWTMLACIDWLCEQGFLREVKFGPCAGQHRIFVLFPWLP